MRPALTILTVIGVIALPSIVVGQSSPPRFHSGSCAEVTQKHDSVFVIHQAIQAFARAVPGGIDTVKVVAEYQVIKDFTEKAGVIVRVVPADRNVRGGGALVWVDSETFCAISLVESQYDGAECLSVGARRQRVRWTS